MYVIRKINDSDIDTVANYEVEISKISFADKAIIDCDFYRKKISMAKEKSGMMVISDDDTNEVLGWLWMEKKRNSLTGEVYINFKSFYIQEKIRGRKIVDELLDAGIAYAKQCKASYIVGKVHSKNIAMRYLYKNHNFSPTHITMEMDLTEDE